MVVPPTDVSTDLHGPDHHNMENIVRENLCDHMNRLYFVVSPACVKNVNKLENASDPSCEVN